jgi:hypothetical protein
MAYVRENGVHKDDKDKQWSVSLRDFALDVMQLTFAINSAAGKRNSEKQTHEKWVNLFKRQDLLISSSKNNFVLEQQNEQRR